MIISTDQATARGRCFVTAHASFYELLLSIDYLLKGQQSKMYSVYAKSISIHSLRLLSHNRLLTQFCRVALYIYSLLRFLVHLYDEGR
jgi:hypothetical protein